MNTSRFLHKESCWAILWLLVVCLLLAHQYLLWFGGALHLNTDVMALLPSEHRDTQSEYASKQTMQLSAQRVQVLLGAQQWDDVRQAAAMVEKRLQSAGLRPRKPNELLGSDGRVLDYYRQHANGLLTRDDRKRLQIQTGEELAQSVLAELYQPVTVRAVSWKSDPLGVLSNWLTARMRFSPVRLRDGRLFVSDSANAYVFLSFETTASAFAFDGQARLQPVLNAAFAEVHQRYPRMEAFAAGVPVIAEAIAAQANREVSTVGLGSMLGIVALIWLVFRSVKPIVLVSLSLAVGVVAGISACVAVFGEMHILTLVFGASLIGVAEDYGIHYFSMRSVETAGASRFALMRALRTSLWMAMFTTLLGYIVFAVTPFPGLRQMAVFSAAGLLAAFVTVLLWFPFLDRTGVGTTRFAQAWADSRLHWPRLSGRAILGVCLVIGLAAALSALHSRVDDDVRILSSAPVDLLKTQQKLSELLQLPSPTQFFLVTADTEEQLLQTEEVFTPHLDALVGKRELSSYVALSDWVPSLARQHADAGLIARATQKTMDALTTQIQLDTQNLARVAGKPMTIESALAGGMPQALRWLWLGKIDSQYASVIALQGFERAALAKFAALDGRVAGVRFVDQTGRISQLIGKYRQMLTVLLGIAYFLVWGALWKRFRSDAWRALLPTALASLIALAVLNWAGQSIQIFNILALLLLLGLGVDYGIFMLEHSSRRNEACRRSGAAWLAVGVGAVTTLLSFGLLGVSHTQALASFGCTMALGVVSSWLLTPMICHGFESDMDGRAENNR